MSKAFDRSRCVILPTAPRGKRPCAVGWVPHPHLVRDRFRFRVGGAPKDHHFVPREHRTVHCPGRRSIFSLLELVPLHRNTSENPEEQQSFRLILQKRFFKNTKTLNSFLNFAWASHLNTFQSTLHITKFLFKSVLYITNFPFQPNAFHAFLHCVFEQPQRCHY